MGRLRLNPTRKTVEERSGSAITITQNASAADLVAFFGGAGLTLPAVTVSSAMRVPAVASAVNFLSRTLATLDLQAWRSTSSGPQPVGGKLSVIIKDAPNPEWSAFEARRYFWTQVFQHGRGLMVIVRDERGQPVELWPLNSQFVRVTMDAFGRKTYSVSVNNGPMQSNRTYPASDVIDVPFALASDQINVESPIRQGEKAIGLALAMGEYAAKFFAGGGVPPLAIESAMAQGPDAMNRAVAGIADVVDMAKRSDKPFFALPPGFKLNPIGLDPDKGQMTDARRFQVEEIARVFQLPPMFLQDLQDATLANAEQQDLHLVKHNLAHWATALESEMNLKLFGQFNARRFVHHDFNSLLRGDLTSRMEALTRSVQGGIRTPNEARDLEGLPRVADPAADQLFMQGATLPIGELGEDAAPDGDETSIDNQTETDN